MNGEKENLTLKTRKTKGGPELDLYKLGKRKAKIAGKAGYPLGYAENDEFVPMVDKVVDVAWQKEMSRQKSFASRGTPLPSDVEKTKKVSVLKDHNILDLTTSLFVKEEFRPPSPTPIFADSDLLPSVLKKQCDPEEKVETFQAKPSEMPYEKEELLDAAIYRVDALEAELIATKKVLSPMV